MHQLSQFIWVSWHSFLAQFVEVGKKGVNLIEKRTFFCTRGRSRTGTVLLPLVFETNASTNSATRAFKERQACFPACLLGCKYG
jgi:hypothetical protein